MAMGLKWCFENLSGEPDVARAGPSVPEVHERIQPPRVPNRSVSRKFFKRERGVHAKALRSRAFWAGCLASETPGTERSHNNECKTHQVVRDQNLHQGGGRGEHVEATTSSARAADPDLSVAKAMDTSINDESPQKMDEEAFARIPAEADEGQVSRTARVAKFVLHVR